jgi:hypothetical protein
MEVGLGIVETGLAGTIGIETVLGKLINPAPQLELPTGGKGNSSLG